MGVHPTCKVVPLRTASKIVALVDMTLGIIGIIWFVIMLGKYDIVSLDPFENPQEPVNSKSVPLDALNAPQRKLSTNHKIIGLTLSGLFTFINFILFVVLLVGVHMKHIGLCLTWFYIRCAVIVFKLIIFVMYLIDGRPLFSQIPFIAFMLIHMYGLWVVNRYVEELRSMSYQSHVDHKLGRKSDAGEGSNAIEKLTQKRKELYADKGADNKVVDVA